MAARQLVLCAPLSFAFTKLKKLELKRLKCTMGHFYPLTEIIAAKERLQLDAEKLQLEGIPDLPKRRRYRESDGEGSRGHIYIDQLSGRA